MRAPIDKAPAAFLLLLVLGATWAFAWVNISNAEGLAPQWGQDLAFFHQWVHSASTGGPWGSPLILEPQGFFEQVHTHLVLPLVVGIYTIWPQQKVLLILHSFFVALAVWPTFRLAEHVAGGRHAMLCTIALLCFGPFQAIAIADFRPVGLFLPGIIGVWLGARKGSTLTMLAWAGVALLGRQEASYLIFLSGLALLFWRWGESKRSHGLVLVIFGIAAWGCFTALKPSMFFHINPLAPSEAWPTSIELWDRRIAFGVALALSGWALGLLSPLPLIAALPVFIGFLGSSREWHALEGPGVHHHAFWLPFAIVAGIVAVSKIPKNIGPLVLVVGSTFSFSWVTTQSRNVSLQALVDLVPPDARVAADYDTIHRLSGREVLWNVDQMYMEDKPWHWRDDWPLTENHVDWCLMPSTHPLGQRLGHWTVVATQGTHVLLQRP